MRGEDDVSIRVADAVGEEGDQPGIVVPALDEDHACAACDGFVEQAPVAGDREPAVVGREHEADESRRAAASAASTASAIRGAQCFIPVKTGSPSSALERGPRRLGDRVERIRVLDPERAIARDEISRFSGEIGRPPRMSA